MKSLLILLSLLYFTSCSEVKYCTLPNAVTNSEDCFNQATLDEEKHQCCIFKVETSSEGTINICYPLNIEIKEVLVESVATQMIKSYKKRHGMDDELKYKGYDCGNNGNKDYEDGNKWIYLKFGFLLLFLFFI